MEDLGIKVGIHRCYCQIPSGPTIVEHLSQNLDYLEVMKCLWILTQETDQRWVEFNLLGKDWKIDLLECDIRVEMKTRGYPMNSGTWLGNSNI